MAQGRAVSRIISGKLGEKFQTREFTQIFSLPLKIYVEKLLSLH